MQTLQTKPYLKNLSFENLILWENKDFIAVSKPPYLSSLDERTKDRSVSLLALARQALPTAQLCHRLDKETSGVMLIAKNPEAYRHASMQFEKREVLKKYHAVVDGVHQFKEVTVFLPISPLKDRTAVKIDYANGKESETVFFTHTIFQRHTLVECFPVTGRMHQIRIHLSHIKAPITGDVQYGGKNLYLSEFKRKFQLKKETDELPIMQRVALHAYSLSFHDLEGEAITVIAEYPKDFSILMKHLEKYK